MIRDFLETEDALAFANVPAKLWENCYARGMLPEAPKAVRRGQPRQFDVPDLVSAYCLGELYERGVVPSFACQIATDIVRLIRKKPEIEVLSAWKCAGRDGTPYVRVAETAPSPTAIELFRFQTGEIRRRAIAGIRQPGREAQH